MESKWNDALSNNTSDPNRAAQRVFVGNLKPHIVRVDLFDIFSKYGEVTAISINRQGYGFVQYSDEDAAQQALSENGAQVKSCTLQVKPCSVNDLRKKRRDRSRSRSPLPTTPQRYGNENSLDRRRSSSRSPPPVKRSPSPPRGRGGPPPRGPRYDGGFQRDGGNGNYRAEGGSSSYRGEGVNNSNSGGYRSDGHRSGRSPPRRSSSQSQYVPSHHHRGPPLDAPRKPNDCEIVVMSKQQRDYAENVERRLKNLGLKVDVLFLKDEALLAQALDDLGLRGTLYACVIGEQHEVHNSVTLNVLYGVPQGQLAQQRVRPSAPLAPSAAALRYNHRGQSYGVYRSTFPVRTGAPQRSKLSNAIIRQPVPNAHHSHNRVFVRKKELPTIEATTVDIPSITQIAQGRLSPAGSLASVSSSVSSVKEAHDEPPSSTSTSSIPSPQSLPASSSSSYSIMDSVVAQISPIQTPTPPDEAPNWARVDTRLVIPLGDNSSDDSDGEDMAVQAHREALHRILHPVKEVKQPLAQGSQSIVFRTATKLVKHGALHRPSATAVAALKAAVVASRHSKIGSLDMKYILTNSSNIQKSKKSNHHHNISHSNNKSITNCTPNFMSSSNSKKHPTIVARSSLQPKLLSLASPSASSTAALPPYFATASGSPGKGLRQVSKFKLTTISNSRSSELIPGGSISSSNSKQSGLKRHSAAHVTSAFGLPSAHRLLIKAASSPSLKKLPVHPTRFKLTREINSANSTLGATRSGVQASGVSILSGRIVKKSSLRLQNLLMLRGVPFQTSKGGKVLKRINTSLHRRGQAVSASSVGLQQSFRRFKTSRMASGTVRQVMGKATTTESIVGRAVASHLVSRSIFELNNKRRLQATPSLSSQGKGKEAKDCLFYIRFGKCHKGDACKFTHDPSKVSICTRFLKGTCKSTTCPFSHEVSADRMPLCSYFQRGQCTAQACPYRHTYFRKDVPYCLDFLQSFCMKGEKCTKQHVLVCMDPECSRDPKKCPLRHKKSRSKDCFSGKTTQRSRKKRKKVVLVAKDVSKEAWPEFVTLTDDQDASSVGGDLVDEADEEVQVEMPSRARSRRLKRFLERRARPIWPDYSVQLSAVRLDSRQLTRMPGHRLRQLTKKARWMRRVPRPIRIPGEFIPLIVSDDRACNNEDGVCLKTDMSTSLRSEEKPLSRDHWSEVSDVEVSVTEDDMLLELTYGDAINLARKRENSIASELSVSSYTSPESDYSSNDESSADADNGANKQYEEKDWLLEYLYSLEKSPSPSPEPERLDNYGPIYEHWEFQIGDKIRKAIYRYRRRKRRHIRREERKRGVSASAIAKKRELIAEDYIPLWTQEEGEILSEDEVEGVDLDVVDMELASDVEEGASTQGLLRGSPIGAEEISSDEEGLANASEDEAVNEGRSRLKQGAAVHINGAEIISDVEDISDVEEGEVF
ncbi:uncharacterized protein LOC111245810 isoform X3 [Varroa destructor]|uniref:Zinc finger CCCH domain-containing protein 3 n=1 Tax=Varroa destructor TaxID=109461 RepID=A0A7M7JHH2_VARDE|nr:uncharacterized protein LOC111245810 isoform X3 [Varroa destructor]